MAQRKINSFFMKTGSQQQPHPQLQGSKDPSSQIGGEQGAESVSEKGNTVIVQDLSSHKAGGQGADSEKGDTVTSNTCCITLFVFLEEDSDFIIPNERLARDNYIRRGPIQKELESYPLTLIRENKRSFSKNWFEKYKWLEYNKFKDAAYCFPCRVFGCSSVFDKKFALEGFRDWKSALENGKGFSRHNASHNHIENFKKWHMYLITTPVDEQLSTQKANQIKLQTKERENRYDALLRLTDISSTLARLRLPFRGHDESVDSKNKGVFREITELVARYDEVLQTHLESSKKNPKGVPSYISAKSQNEMITCIGNECLIDVVHVKDTSGAALANHLLETLEKFGLDVKNVRGQGYDGCAAMSGVYKGVQAIIKQKCEKAYFVHCYAHRLNLVVVDMCCKNTATRNFFGLVEQLYLFMEGSAKRHCFFIDVQKKLAAERDDKKTQTLKSLSSTRWATRLDNCKALLEALPSVIETLDQIQTGDRFDKESSGTAMALSKAIDFEFCLHLVALSRILSVTGVLSRYLQKEDMDICAAALLVEDCREQLVSMRSDEVFEEIWTETMTLSSTINVEFQENKRARKVSKRLDDRWQSQTLLSQREEMKINFYFAALDLSIQSITDRFNCKTLSLLKHTVCLTKPSSENVSHFKSLCGFFDGDVDVEIAETEYRMFIHRLQREEQCPSSLMDIFIYMVEKKCLMTYPELSRLTNSLSHFL
nr:zinc finger MYM-type protein 1-like [Misgurnus anguillicaudatus]